MTDLRGCEAIDPMAALCAWNDFWQDQSETGAGSNCTEAKGFGRSLLGQGDFLVPFRVPSLLLVALRNLLRGQALFLAVLVFGRGRFGTFWFIVIQRGH